MPAGTVQVHPEEPDGNVTVVLPDALPYVGTQAAACAGSASIDTPTRRANADARTSPRRRRARSNDLITGASGFTRRWSPPILRGFDVNDRPRGVPGFMTTRPNMKVTRVDVRPAESALLRCKSSE